MKQRPTPRIDPQTERAVRMFMQRVSDEYDLDGAILFGSRARRDHRPDSDVDQCGTEVARSNRPPAARRVRQAADLDTSAKQ